MSDTWITATVILVIILVAPVLLSYVVEALRRAPSAPTRLQWDPEIPIRYAEVDGIKLRYITIGEGPPMVLLHTLRTQLDMFQKVIPALSQHYTVYALDYPGHGFSDIPKVEYTPEFITGSVGGFLDAMRLVDTIVVGESIGGALPLGLAAHHSPRIKKVIAINPYDYGAGRGAMRSSWLAKLLFGLNNVPILGATNWRFRSLVTFRKIMQGGVYHGDALAPALLQEMHKVGNRPHHYRAFMSLVRHLTEWDRKRVDYGEIKIPVLLIYGDHDWSRPEEREANREAIPKAEMTIVKDAGHFLSVDAPDEAVRLILDFSADGA